MASSFTSPVTIDGMDVLSGMLIPGGAQRHVVTRATVTDETYKYWSQNMDPVYHHTSITAGLAACTSGRNDIVLLSPDSHSQAALLTWNKNMTHLIGMYGPHMMCQRARIGHSANFAIMINITGFGCTFANLLVQHGRGSATNLTGVKVTGNRNSFINCHIGGPMHATEGDEAAYKLIHFTETSGGDGLEHYFKNCTIGVDTVAWTAGTMLKTAGTPRLVFEDCNLIMRADANAPRFLDGTAADGQGFVIFKNCVIHNFGTTLTVAFGSTGLHANTDYILAGKTTIGGATDVIDDADEAKVFVPAAVGVTEDIYAGLSIPVDADA